MKSEVTGGSSDSRAGNGGSSDKSKGNAEWSSSVTRDCTIRDIQRGRLG